MVNVLKDEKKQQIIALGRLGWSLRKIQKATRVRRETISAYLRGAGVEIWPPGRWKREGKAKPAIQVITGSEEAKPASPESGGPPNFNLNPTPENLSTKGKATATSKPAIAVITDFGVGLSGKEPENSKVVGSASTCKPYREIIELGLSRDRNAMAIWQDLVSDYGFQGGYQSVRRFAYKLRGAQGPHARAGLLRAPGEEWAGGCGTRAGGRTHKQHAAQVKTLRERGGRASLSGSLGNELGVYAHSRHHETASGCHVRRRKTNPAHAAYRTVPLLPVRRTGGASGWLCRSRSRVLRSTARLERTWGQSPMG